jgi:hypothetical protein
MKAHKGEESFASVRGQPGPFSLTLTKGRVFRPRTLQFPCPALQTISVAGSVRSAERRWLSVTLPTSGARRQNADGCPKETLLLSP